jgi:hypothetical protein
LRKATVITSKYTTSKKLSAFLIIFGFVIFIIPFFQILGAILMLAGWIINIRTDRSKKQKTLWSIPLIVHLVLVSIIVILNHI